MSFLTNRHRGTWILLLACCYGVTHCRRYEKCTTLDDRQGVCVVKRYCRVAASEPSSLSRCGDFGDMFCCPVPTTRSAAGNVVPPIRTSTTTIEPDRRPLPASRDKMRKDEDRREEPRRQGDGLSRPPEPADEERDERPGNKVLPSRPSDPGARNQAFDAYDRDAYGESYPSYGRGRAETSRAPARRPVSSQAPIKFPSETSIPQPTVPACGVKPYDLFIAGGEKSGEHEWPWMAAIYRRHVGTRPNTFLCGGSLINSRYVLSAAHCFVHNYVILPASSFIVRLGSHYLDSGEDYTVSTVVVHHNHSGADFFNDIALVRLASEVYITDKIAPVCLPFEGMQGESFVGRMATVAGWGDTSFRVSGTRILQHVTVPIVSSEECSAAYSRVRGAAFLARGTNHVICAGLREGGKDACLGDSGGPLMLKEDGDRWIIVGIVSLGYKCAEPGYPGVYTRVTHYLNWIYSNMKRY